MLRVLSAVAGAFLVAACASAPSVPPALDPSNPEAAQSPPVRTESVLDAPSIVQLPATAKADPPAAHAEHGAEPARDSGVSGDTVYVCPMHPEVRSDKPGQCPKCGMNLVPEKKRKKAPATDHSSHAPPSEDRSSHPPATEDHSSHASPTKEQPSRTAPTEDHSSHAPATKDHSSHVPAAPTAPSTTPPPAKKPGATKKAAPVYSCPMHPEVRSDKPGRCPKCGMPLELEKPKTGGAR